MMPWHRGQCSEFTAASGSMADVAGISTGSPRRETTSADRPPGRQVSASMLAKQSRK